MAPNKQARISGIQPKCKASESLEGLSPPVCAPENIDLAQPTPANAFEISRYVGQSGVYKNVDEIEVRAEAVRQFSRRIQPSAQQNVHPLKLWDGTFCSEFPPKTRAHPSEMLSPNNNRFEVLFSSRADKMVARRP